MGLEDGNFQPKPHQDHPNTNPSLPTPTSSGTQEAMDILRCAPMTLLQLYIPAEAAQTTVAELGSLGLVQFRDVFKIVIL